MKTIFLWGGVGVVITAGIFLVLSFAAPPEQTQTSSSLSLPVLTQRGHMKGNPEASVALVEYGDFQCPACATYAPVINQLAAEFGDQIAIVYRHFPLVQIHENAEPAARAAEAAALQGKFWEIHDLLYEKQSEWSRQSNAAETFVGYATELGLDGERFRRDLGLDEVRKHVQEDLTSALADGLNGTPSFFLDGVQIPLPQSYEQFRQLVLGALAKHGNSSE